MSDQFSEADHERARRAGRQAMAKTQPKQPKQPRERKPHPGWRFLFGWLALTQLIAFGVAIVHLFHSVTWESGFPMVLATWPILVHPHWLAALLAFAALFLLSLVWGALSSRSDDQPSSS